MRSQVKFIYCDISYQHWSSPQTISVTVVDDFIAEGPRIAMITHTATRGNTNYDGITIPNVCVNITDNDTVGTNNTPASITTGEDDTADTFTITLDSEPTDDVAPSQ